MKDGVINARLEELEALLQSTAYAKQKSRLQIYLELFLKSMRPAKFLSGAHPTDITKFLVFKDKKGKTQVHLSSCVNLGSKGQFNCGCPLRAAAGSVDSLIRKIRAIYRDLGYSTEWNESLGSGNPAAAPCIKRYLSAIKLEQSLSSVSPKQARPLFSSKLCLISRHISYKLKNPKNSVLQQYLFNRDLTFFNLLLHTGDRSADLGGLLANQISYLPDGSGVLFSMTKGKTTDISDPRFVFIFYSQKAEFCPVRLLVDFLHFCKEHSLISQTGYIFRNLIGSNKLNEKPLSSQSANARLRLYLQRLKIWEGETPHGMRGACAIMLAQLGVDKDAIKAHVGRKSDKMFEHYTLGQKLCKKRSAANALSACSSSRSLEIENKMKLYKDIDSFKKVVE